MKEWVNLVCPMHSRATKFLLFWYYKDPYSFLLKWAVLGRACCGVFFSHNCCHFFINIWLIFRLRSVYGIFDFLLGTILRSTLANEFALSFPWIPVRIEIQQNVTFLLWFMKFSLLRSLTMQWLSNFESLSDCRTEMESEWTINFSLLLVETCLSANFIV